MRDEELLTTREAARRLGVTIQLIYHLIKLGELDAPYPGVVTAASLTRVATTTPATLMGAPRTEDKKER
jgi:excisionase family DNA binding protein